MASGGPARRPANPGASPPPRPYRSQPAATTAAAPVMPTIQRMASGFLWVPLRVPLDPPKFGRATYRV